MADTRYAFLALPIEMQELGYPKEIMVDYETGHIYIKSIDGFTNLGKTKELEDLINQLKSDGGDLIYVTIDGENSQLLNIVLRNIFMNLSTINADLENKIDVSKIGVANGVAPLDENKVIPISYLPNEIKEIIIVNNIAERNSIPNANKFRGLNVYVTDATGDTTVTSGGAYYLWDGVKWVKTSESESLDIVLRWGNISEIPFATTAEAESGINDTNIMTPLKVRRAILAMGGSGGGSGRNVYINGISEWQYTAATTNRNIVVPSTIYDPAKAFLVVSYDGLDAFENVDYVINGNTVTLSFDPVIGVIIRFLIFKISYEYRDLAGLPDIATLAQAEAGTNDTALMTPLKTKNAINKLKHEYNHDDRYYTEIEIDQKLSNIKQKNNIAYIKSGSSGWVIPLNITSINIFLCGNGGRGGQGLKPSNNKGYVGGGGGSGGGIRYYFNIPVVPGEKLIYSDNILSIPSRSSITYSTVSGNNGNSAKVDQEGHWYTPGQGAYTVGSGSGGTGGYKCMQSDDVSIYYGAESTPGSGGIVCMFDGLIYGVGGCGGSDNFFIPTNSRPMELRPGSGGHGGASSGSYRNGNNGIAVIQY